MSKFRVNMQRVDKRWLVWGLPAVFLMLIAGTRYFPVWGEGYARMIYPQISAVLSGLSSCFRFSVGDLFIAFCCIGCIVYPFYGWWRHKKAGIIFKNIFLAGIWLYIWFYLAWGINYFRLPFYERTGRAKAEFSPESFREFLADYTIRLNEAYQAAGDSLAFWYLQPYAVSSALDQVKIEEEVRKGYEKLSFSFGLLQPSANIRVKPMLWSRGMSKVGVTGYMGPFFAEFNLNQELLNIGYPFTYAHELAHRLGIAGEAEANLYAYLVTTGSSAAEARFSGYFSILGYITRNARQLLIQEEYQKILKEIRPEIICLYQKHFNYWHEKYHPSAGKLQNTLYNVYLKGNQVSRGTRDYSEVVGLLMSLWEEERRS